MKCPKCNKKAKASATRFIDILIHKEELEPVNVVLNSLLMKELKKINRILVNILNKRRKNIIEKYWQNLLKI